VQSEVLYFDVWFILTIFIAKNVCTFNINYKEAQTKMAKKLQYTLKDCKVSLHFGYFAIENVWWIKDIYMLYN